MIKLILAIALIFNFLNASSKSIEKKIETNKSILDKSKSRKMRTTLKIKLLAKQIESQNQELTNLEKQIINVNNDIKKHQNLLDTSRENLNKLQEKSKNLIEKKKTNEEQIVDTIIENFTSSIAIKLAKESSEKELIDKEIYTLLSQHSKDEILKLNNNYETITLNKKENEKKIDTIKEYIEERTKKKVELNKLINEHSNSIKSLENKHETYQKELKSVIKKQQELSSLLSQLNILKSKELEKEKARRERARLLALKKKREQQRKGQSNTKNEVQKRYAQDIDLDVRMLGSSTRGVKISRYRGKKTISPLKSFKVIKKFGKYYDPVYKIKLFNESVILKTNRPKAKVFAIFNGKIVYAKKNAGMLENVVIVQHSNGLHTIYSHLDEIAPTLKVGKWIKKGYVIGRVSDTLNFQATKNSFHVNPKDLFRI
ncbi:peptidase M23 [Malaciobacter canalis]|jgi:septal ring factor EnvC (AmiA/AmiB activator)|uniref:Septal ring factor EnvC (AmiA/AmiB activator) n=2 Tax=Malaciobacter TaxID=2321114 RepID=A0AB36ZXU7_9BACT|nr:MULTISPECIES: peptidoglycan DD-metalloendopeptidase family protein [Malaciobacter]PHO10168.1 peptidase M23 [Malaciobacter canalis]PPK62154.1 septal ring factor EnvC (AmiA/AmiB activator) [Malaciobacter marinus]QEE32658.1 zinc metallopeptidase, M23 family [Malaciobacter canalis]